MKLLRAQCLSQRDSFLVLCYRARNLVWHSKHLLSFFKGSQESQSDGVVMEENRK